MKFTIFKTSRDMYVETSRWYSRERVNKFKNTPPCKGAILIEEEFPVTTKIRDENGRLIEFLTGKTIQKYHWEIEINTIEELMNFLAEVDHEAIFDDDGTIEIYDAYRE